MKAAVLLAFALAGCVSLPADPTKMSAEQLREWAKDRNANVSCAVVNSPYGRGVMTYVTLDKGIVVDGTVTVNDQCQVTISSTRPAPAPKAEPEPKARAGELQQLLREPVICYRSSGAIVCEKEPK